MVYKNARIGQIRGAIRRVRIQTTDYTQGDAFQAEKRTVFSQGWLPLCAEGQIGRPGDFLAQSVGGWSVLGVRDREGAVRVLRNACRHQNMPVAGQPAGNCETFRCRFHGWTYDLQGKFVSAPPPVAPADTSPGANDLAVLPMRQMAGLVFFAIEGASSGFFPPGPGQPYSGTIVTDMACNWKVCMEHLLGSQDASEPEFAWFWPLLVMRRSGPVVLVEQVVPHTFLRTKLFTHVFGGAVEAQKFSAATIKETCETEQKERANDTSARGSALVAQFHQQLGEAYAGSS
ncbi:MAG: Rieske (2Fe-2S) protein [Proteobacteria bacterium]|nr:Rieske (2Fe-2S) protein [Pseudomonadota bacterium]